MVREWATEDASARLAAAERELIVAETHQGRMVKQVQDAQRLLNESGANVIFARGVLVGLREALVVQPEPVKEQEPT